MMEGYVGGNLEDSGRLTLGMTPTHVLGEGGNHLGSLVGREKTRPLAWPPSRPDADADAGEDGRGSRLVIRRTVEVLAFWGEE